MGDSQVDVGSTFEHRVFVAGFSLHVLSGTLATIATFLDFNWQSPAAPGFGDPEEPLTAISVPLTAFMLFYLASNFPASLAWATSAGWTFNTGFIWLLAAAGFYDGLRKKKVRIIASSVQSFFGIIALGLASAVGDKAGFHPVYGAESNWTGSIGMLTVSVIMTISAACLAWLTPTPTKQTALAQGWVTDAHEEEHDSFNLGSKKKTNKFNKVDPVRCGDLGVCGICNLVCSLILFILWLALIGLAIDFRIREPATSCYAILPTSMPSTLTVSDSLKGQTFSVGLFEVAINADGSVVSAKRGTTNVFSSLSREAFIRAGYGTFSARNDEEMGSYKIDDKNRELSSLQSISAAQSDGSNWVTFTGSLGGYNNAVQIAYSINFTVLPGTNHLAFDLQVDENPLRSNFGNNKNDAVRLYWTHDSTFDEKFFGFGESYTYFDLKGACVPIITREQGIGRGLQPFTYIINRASHDSAGSWQTTYSAVPHYVTNKVRSFYMAESFFAVFDLTRPERMTVELVSSRMRGRFLAESTFLDTIEQYTLYSGRMRPLPAWVGSGAVIGLQGGTASVKRQVDLLLSNGVPLVGVWLQDWSGKRVTSVGDRLLWNWQINNNLYPGWFEMVSEFRSKNISTLTYINPYLHDFAPNEQGVRTQQPMFTEAQNIGCLVRKADNSTLIQFSATTDFTFATVDLTNPFCEDWYMTIIRNNLMNVSAATGGNAYGAMGWMADFAESLPFDAKLFDGDGAEVHNKFPMLWAETCKKAINITSGGVDFAQDVTFFTRSSYATTPEYTTLMWLGDQMQAFNRFDGLETVIPGTVSMGLSGFAFSHSDVGGYVGFSQVGGAIQLVRTKELLIRWMELSAFMDTMFRSHEGIVPRISPQITSDTETMVQFARFARVFKALQPYRQTLITEAATKGYPVARHPLLHFQNDRNLDLLRKQVMLGSELMLCAVTSPGASNTDCYLPAGSGIWTSFFDPTFTKDSTTNGLWFSCPAPLGKPCALVRQGAVSVPLARAALVLEGFSF